MTVFSMRINMNSEPLANFGELRLIVANVAAQLRDDPLPGDHGNAVDTAGNRVGWWQVTPQ